MAAIRDPNSLRRCLYEVLGVERTATGAEIKTAYRKLALEFHPDKNIHQAEVAAEKFKEVQYAYSILSDDQERAWYDSHRDAILRGVDEEDAAVFEGINLWPFLSPQCYSGYTDEPNGFYAVYNKLFEDLDNEEKAETPGEAAPKFGQSTSDYKSVLRFYNYWSNFVSKRSYAYADKYKPSEAPNRKIKKLIEKDNKKEREKARKARMELIKHLVDFVKKRDKRLMEHQQRIKKEEELKMAEEKIKNEQEKQQRRLQKDEYEQQRWEEIEKEIDWSELMDHDNVSDKKKKKKNEGQAEEQELYCAVCNKSFKSKKQWENHERSKSHKERLEILKAEVTLDDDIEAELNEQEEDIQDKEDEEHEKVETEVLSEESSEEEEQAPPPKPTKSKQQTKKQNKHNKPEKQTTKKTKPTKEVQKEPEQDEEEEEEQEELDDYSFVQNMMKLRKQQKKNKKKNLNNRFADLSTKDSEEESEEEEEKDEKPAPVVETQEDDDDEEEESEEEEKEDKPVPTNKPQTKSQPQNNNNAKAAKPKKKAKKKGTDPPNYCVTCKTKFDTRNQLFKHLKDTGHAKPV